MANATLTSGLTANTTYTSLAVTAMPVSAASGEIVWVGLTLSTVEPFVTSASVAANATSISVVSRAATSNHAVGQQVAPNHTLTQTNRTASPIQTPRGTRL